MLSSLRIGAAATFVLAAAAIAGYAPSVSATPAGSVSSMESASNYPPSSGWTGEKITGFPLYDDESEPILPRAFRSKCDDLTDLGQRLHCFRAEQDDAMKDKDGYPL